MKEGLYVKALFCNAFQKRVDIFTAEGHLPICLETSKEGVCDDRYCIWSMGVALGLKLRAESSGEDLWDLREMVFYGPLWTIDWCESAWEISQKSPPVGYLKQYFSRDDVLTADTRVLIEAIEKAVATTAREGKLRFFDLGSLEFPPDGREPGETPKIVLWAQKCVEAFPDILFWMGPITMSWFLPCLRPQNVHREIGEGPVLKLELHDLEEIVMMGRAVAIKRLRDMSISDEVISRICLLSDHKLAWSLCKGRPPIIYMGAGHNNESSI